MNAPSHMPLLPEQAAAPTTAWQACAENFALPLRQQIGQLVDQCAEAISDRFYTVMLADPQANQMLDHGVVNQRLHAAMAHWLRTVFNPAVPVDQLAEMQLRTGRVHARIGVAPLLVSRSARVVQREIVSRIAHMRFSRGHLAEAVQYVYEWIDLAVESMNAAYASDAQRLVRADEAYRLFVLNQNVRAERERRRSQLLEWANQVLMGTYWRDDGMALDTPSLTPLGDSEFGLWLQHKAGILFEGAPELASIHTAAEAIEHTLLPNLRAQAHEPLRARELMAQLNQQIARIKHLLGVMFDRAAEADEGQQAPHLLNRRYFPAVVKREITLAQHSGRSFALVLAEVDHFDHVGAALGLDAADLVLGSLAERLQDAVRAGDFMFRLGQHLLALLLVDMQPEALHGVADGLRQQVAQTRVRTPHGVSTAVTVTVGGAMFNGHPDYQQLLDRAEAALREARQAGPNCTVVHA